jgi:hypothetical protein
MTNALNYLDQWCEASGMEINKSKSAVLVIRNDKRTRDPEYTSINGYPIRNDYNYLGVKFTDTGSTKSHTAA